MSPHPDLDELVQGARELDKHAVARLISVFEDRRAAAPARRAHVRSAHDAAPVRPPGAVLGITGT
ncbi:MAG: hypothetical protein ACK4V6_17095, partial [Microthrixaceae bacterium]